MKYVWEVEVVQSRHGVYGEKSEYFCYSDFVIYCMVQIYT